VTYVEHATLTWPEAIALGRDGNALGLICVAALEQHGPALPLCTDAAIGEVLARRLADSFAEPVIVMPVPYGGLSDHHLGFPGTVSFDDATLRGIVDAYVAGLTSMSVRNVFVFTSHGGNFGFLSQLSSDYGARDDLVLATYDDRDRYFATTFAGARQGGFDPAETDWHAGGIETSQGLAEFPHLVRPFEDVVGYTAAEPGWLQRTLEHGLHTVSESGVLGSPQGANATAGAAIFDALVDLLVTRVEEAFGLSRIT
jgi:creatinine amidohydrolase